MKQRQVVIAIEPGETRCLNTVEDAVILEVSPGDHHSPESCFLRYIVDNYETLAPQTVFVDLYSEDRIGDLSNGLAKLPTDVPFVRIGEHLRIANRDNTDGSVFTWASKSEFVAWRSGSSFAVSRDCVHSHPQNVYEETLRNVHEAHAREYLEQSWQELFVSETGTRGIVTAADSNLFRDLQFMIESLRLVDASPIVVYDLGLRHEQLLWCLAQPKVTCRPIPVLSRAMRKFVGQNRWQAWLKPAYLKDVPFDRFLWIDADCVVVSPLDDAFAEIDKGPMLMPEVAPGCGSNHEKLYTTYLPIKDPASRKVTEINNGVIGFCRHRDQELLDAWLFSVEWAIENPELRHLFRWYDQGALLWAILRTHNEHFIRGSKKWNYPANPNGTLLQHAIGNSVSVIDTIRTMHPNAGIVHWFGLLKLSISLDDEVNALFTNRSVATASQQSESKIVER